MTFLPSVPSNSYATLPHEAFSDLSAYASIFMVLPIHWSVSYQKSLE